MKRLLASLVLFLYVMLLSSSIVFAAGNNITLKITSRINPDEIKGFLISCTHYYSIEQNGKEIVPITILPNNVVTNVVLPKSKEGYVAHFYDLRVYKQGTDPLDTLSIKHEFAGNKNSEITFTAGDLWGGGHGIENFNSKGFNIINSMASASSGETDVTIPIAIFAAVAGAVAAGAAAGVGGLSAAASDGSGSSNEKSSNGSTYKMAIKKDFGDKIKYNAESVAVYARIIEVNKEGIELDRPDLTQDISIFCETPLLEVGASALVGNYMAAGVIAGKAATAETNDYAVISFRFDGPMGTFQNNVKFQVVGDCLIELEKEKLFVLGGSSEIFELAYKPVNFMFDVEEIIVKTMSDQPFIAISTGKNREGKTVITVKDTSPPKPVEEFFDSIACEIIVKNTKEYARTVFYTVLCYEGILPDFLGKKKEIIAYKNDKDEMPETTVAFRLGTWNEVDKVLDVRRPENVDVSFSDKDEIFEVIGLENQLDEERSTSDYLLYVFKAEKPLPSVSAITGKLTSVYKSEKLAFENETQVKLMPDIIAYEKELEKEYQNCIKIIDTYLPTQFRSKKLDQLNAGKGKMGLKDLQLFRKNCWEIASRCIMQEKESYLIDSYWYDEAIATAELVVYVGDVALDIALTPFGGPIAGFVISQVKASLLELIAMRIEKGSIGYDEIYELVINRLKQGAGQADGLIETPGFDQPKKLAAWLSCYLLYRIMNHWFFDKEENGDPKGLLEAIQSGLMDFAGKGSSLLLGEFAKGIAKKRGIDVGSTADAEQKWVNDKVSKATKGTLDTLDTAANAIDKKIADFTSVLSEYIDRIKNGGIQFT